MIHKFQNIHGLIYVLDGSSKDTITEIQNLIEKIKKEKNLPFNTVYVKIPVFWANKFIDKIEQEGLKIKSSFHKKNEIMMEF
jgi:hypothetical protein